MYASELALGWLALAGLAGWLMLAALSALAENRQH